MSPDALSFCELIPTNRSPAYSSDAVYLYSTQDDAEEVPRESAVHSPNGSVVPPNAKRRKVELLAELADMDADTDALEDIDMHDLEQEEDDDASFLDDAGEDSDESGDHSEDDEFTEEVEDMEKWGFLRGKGAGYENVPVVYPRRRFVGACNVETVKDGALTDLVSNPLRRTDPEFLSSEFPWS